ncbi:MAG: hypothetical protein Q9O62_13480 [Ardenticatenia bacterium]|nr:hypothetical protein [Ardenticatenia bacterium]
MISLLSHGCPKEAIVATFDLDPRTVDRWWRSSGQHAQQIHQALVQRPRDLLQVQLDELRHKVQGAVLWIAMATAKQDNWVPVIHRTDRCDLSLFQLGLNLLDYFLNEHSPIPVAFQIPPLSESVR